MSETVLDQRSASALAKELGRSFTGDVLVAGQPEYDEARTVWNAMVDKKPMVIARCGTTRDVIASVKLARAYGGQERYDRLARVKAQYDPDDFFRSNNAAIAPIGGRSRLTT